MDDKKKKVLLHEVDKILSLYNIDNSFGLKEEEELKSFVEELITERIKHKKMKNTFMEQLNSVLENKIYKDPGITVKELDDYYILKTPHFVLEFRFEQFGRFTCLFTKDGQFMKSFPLQSELLYTDNKNIYVLDKFNCCKHFQYINNDWVNVYTFYNTKLVSFISDKLMEIIYINNENALYNQEEHKIMYESFYDIKVIAEGKDNKCYQVERIALESDRALILTSYIDSNGNIINDNLSTKIINNIHVLRKS